jgi:P-type E1-E2 ATPase
VGAAELKSNHPLSTATLEEVKRRKLKLSGKVGKFENLAGLGVRAIVGGKNVVVGTVKLMENAGVKLSPLQGKINELLAGGKTIMVLAVNGRLAGVIGAVDPAKPTAKLAVDRLKELGIEVAMITGDNKATALAIARQLGIERVFAEVLPEEKANYVKKLQDEGKFVAMVGDGVNDAPALAQADIGIAIGAGTDVAIESADITLINKDLSSVAQAIILSKKTMRAIKQNLFWAFGYNVILIPVAMGVLYPFFGILMNPIFASVAMALSSISVVANSLRLKRTKI